MTTYKEAGVDIDAGDNFAKDLAAKFNIGLSFAAELDLTTYKHPIISVSTDGVGTKLEYHIKNNTLFNAGLDLVAMTFNDILCTGATPLGFLDYIGVRNINKNQLNNILAGINCGCKLSNATLLGGETAEMYTVPSNLIELAGFGIGVRERDETFGRGQVKAGDRLVGLASNGFHANGYSLISKVLKDYGGVVPPFIEEHLVRPTKIYTQKLKNIKSEGINVKRIAHITGGGIASNVARVLPNNVEVVYNNLDIPPEFKWIQHIGNIPFSEMAKVFNLGIGMVLIVDPRYKIVDGIDIGHII